MPRILRRLNILSGLSQKKSNKFSPEVRERAVRTVQEQRGEYPSLWAAIESIAPKIGCVPQTLHEWVKRMEVDAGVSEGVTPRWRRGLCARRGNALRGRGG